MARRNRHAPTDITEPGGEHIAAADRAAAADVPSLLWRRAIRQRLPSSISAASVT